MPRLQRKSFDRPDQVRSFPHGRIEVIDLDETSLGRFHMEPGWRWSTDVGPSAGPTSCQLRHVGYVISGRLHVTMADGTELEIGPGDAYEIPPGHDGRIVSEEPWDTIEFTSARSFAVGAETLGEQSLATILFTDIVDSTATLSRLGDAAWRELLLEHNDRLRREIDRSRGREVGTTGVGSWHCTTAPVGRSAALRR